jgi:hypothetical protein
MYRLCISEISHLSRNSFFQYALVINDIENPQNLANSFY